MTPSTPSKVDAYRTKSSEATSEMETLFQSGHLSGAVDRAYYAVFHMASALLATIGLEFSSHEALISAFGREFAKTKKLDPKFHRILRDAFDLRLTADYDVESSISEEDARALIEECREFLKIVGNYLDSLQLSEKIRKNHPDAKPFSAAALVRSVRDEEDT